MIKFENIIHDHMLFPIEIFIQDNLQNHIQVDYHWHDCFELLYIQEGTACQSVNGHSFTVRQGSFIFLKTGDIHGTWCEPNVPCRIYVIKFMPSLLYPFQNIQQNFKYFHAFLLHQSLIVPLTSEQQQVLIHLFSKMEQERLSEAPGYDFIIKGYILELIGYLFRQKLLSPCPEFHVPKENPALWQLIHYIEAHYSEPIDLTLVSKTLNFNYHYASRYLKRVTGKNFKQFLDYVRVSEANRLLIETNDSITEISLKCGFNSPQSMSRTYHRLTGSLPSALRRSICQKV